MDIGKAYRAVRTARDQSGKRGDMRYVHATVVEGSVRLASTDGYRLHYADVAGDWGPPRSGVLTDAPSEGTLDLVGSDWPNYAVLLRDPPPVFWRGDSKALLAALNAAPSEHVVIEARGGSGNLYVGATYVGGAVGSRKGAVNPKYLSQAVRAVGGARISLAWGGRYLDPIWVDREPAGPVRALVMPRRED